MVDGPAAGHTVEVGDPPVRRGVIVLGDASFGEDAHRYYLIAVDSTSASYAHGGKVTWPPEAGRAVVATGRIVIAGPE